MEKVNFVFVSLQRIQTDRDSTATNIAKELARLQHRVLYVNAPIDKRTYYLRKPDRYTQAHIDMIRSRSKQSLVHVSENLWMLNPLTVIDSINWIPHTGVFSWFNKRNNRRLAQDIQEAVESIGFEQFVLVNDKDIFRSFHAKELLRPSLYVYLDRDYIIGMGYWKRHGEKLEPELMEKADLILCNSLGFTERAKTYNANSYYIGNGCDMTLFDYYKQFDCPEDLKPLTSRPVIGYVGALLAMRLDIGLLVALAKAKPEWNIVLIGREDEAFASSELHQLDNVHFLGKKDTTQIPAYLQHFDVCINPQLVNDITIDNYPLKIDEYLAMGKPTVAIRTNTMAQVFSPQVRLASGHDSFIGEIAESLHDNHPDQVAARIALAKSHSWHEITKNVLRIIRQHLPERNVQTSMNNGD